MYVIECNIVECNARVLQQYIGNGIKDVYCSVNKFEIHV